MTNRREFVVRAALATGAVPLLFAAKKSAIAAQEAGHHTPASKPLRILVLGATGHIGPSHVRAAMERGHKVSVFSRGKTPTEVPSGVEWLAGDRNGDLASLQNREWDAVLDLATYGPAWVRTLGERLRGRVKHYTFVSSNSVYADPSSNTKGTDEGRRVVEYNAAADPYSITEMGEHYAPLKVLCEREAEKQFPRRTLILRPGDIVGPGERYGMLLYWPARMQRGGEVLVSGDPLTHVQWIDVRDMAEWIIRMVETGGTGTFNAIGPAMPMGFAEMLGAIREAISVPLTLTWVPGTWLRGQKVSERYNPLVWPSEMAALGLMINDRACAQGLSFRPLGATVTDGLAWYKSRTEKDQARLFSGINGTSTLGDSMAREREILKGWHSHRM